MLIELEEKRMEDLEQDAFGYDEDVGYNDYDDWSMNAADGAFCPEALDLGKTNGSPGIVIELSRPHNSRLTR